MKSNGPKKVAKGLAKKAKKANVKDLKPNPKPSTTPNVDKAGAARTRSLSATSKTNPGKLTSSVNNSHTLVKKGVANTPDKSVSGLKAQKAATDTNTKKRTKRAMSTQRTAQKKDTKANLSKPSQRIEAAKKVATKVGNIFKTAARVTPAGASLTAMGAAPRDPAGASTRRKERTSNMRNIHKKK